MFHVFSKRIDYWFFGGLSFENDSFIGQRGVGLWVINSDNLIIAGVHTDFLDIWKWLSLEFLDNTRDVFIITSGLRSIFLNYSLRSTSSCSIDGSESFGEFLSVLNDLLFWCHTL